MTYETDIVIYGGNAAGIMAAVQAVRMGKRVAVIEPSGWIGGLTSGGLGDTDSGDKAVIGGLSGEFYKRLGIKYSQDEPAWLFEPKLALEVFQDLQQEFNIQIYYGERLDLVDGVTKQGNKITQITMESGKVFQAGIYIDTSYEGDLMALAGITVVTGRESNELYGETGNGIQTAHALKNQLPEGIDPYIIQGDPLSGLLPHVNLDAGGVDGVDDTKIQAYCFRMCLTDNPDNRVEITKPEGYVEAEYELLFRSIAAGQRIFFKLAMLPNRKTDSNNDEGFSTDYIGMNYGYPEGDYQTRQAIIKAHEVYQKGLVWTLQNHPRVPQEIRDFYKPWGLPLDEFVDNGHWSPQLYIREARRMVSDVVMNENHIMLKQIVENPVGMGSYAMDSHNVQRHIDANGYVANEGDVQVKSVKPYSISYHSIVPKEAECSNLIVPVCLSSSHIAYGSIRMEPVFMVLGQSAATAAVIALEDKQSVQQIDLNKLADQLLRDGQVLVKKW
ncbi:FAD-dependent oxidoreductase [Paenibacillus psychroresistens]|uniref:FAD-dependent oxidoreductase n=2 Tax=Paenibacillus psychroresistens TaxID=1778678 RepID=A0A6B8RXV2_9BACL|nr:FAD-dependent oxidoreductase [Paenibacillus psychroresistens]